MKKKLVGAVLVAMLLMTQVMGVCAAGSADKGSVTVPSGVTMGSVASSSVPDAVKTAATNVQSATTTAAIKSALSDVGGLSAAMDALEDSYDNVNFSVALVADVTPAAGQNSVTFGGFASDVVKAIFCHYNGTAWEQKTVSVSNGSATVSFATWSPIIAIAVTGTPASSGSNGYHCPNCGHIAWTEHNGGYRCYDCGYLTEGAVTAAVASAATATASPAGAVSPKTGVASDWAVWMTAAMMLMGASVIVLKKRA